MILYPSLEVSQVLVYRRTIFNNLPFPGLSSEDNNYNDPTDVQIISNQDPIFFEDGTGSRIFPTTTKHIPAILKNIFLEGIDDFGDHPIPPIPPVCTTAERNKDIFFRISDPSVNIFYNHGNNNLKVVNYLNIATSGICGLYTLDPNILNGDLIKNV